MSAQPNEIRADLLSTLGLNPFPGHDSSSRAQMFSSHLTQCLVVNKSTERRLQTGVERELAKYTFSIKMPANGRIVKVIERYPRSLSGDVIAFNPETLVIYEDDATQEFGSFIIPTHASYHQHFGFDYVFRPAINRLVPGTYIEKDTIFADSPSVTEDGGYKYGIELNMAFMSTHPVAEDGILISSDVLDKIKFKVFETRSVQFGNHGFPINLYGTVDKYKPFPDIGEYIRPDGLLAMIRDYSKALSPVDMSIHDAMTPDYSFDKSIYSRAGVGRVIDIKVYHDDTIVSTTPIGVADMLQKYVVQTKHYHNQIVSLNKELSWARVKKHGKGSKVKYKPELHRLIVESLAMVDEGGDKSAQRLNYVYRKSPIDDYRVEIIIEYEITPGIGYKLTDCHGGKGVITAVEKPENMPVDANGNRADIVMDAGSTVSRMNLGRLYEHYIGGSCRDTQKRIKDMLGLSNINDHLSDRVLDICSSDSVLFNSVYDYLMGFYKICSPKQFQYCSNASTQDRLNHLAHIVEKGIYLFMPTDNEPESVHIIQQLEKDYRPCYGPVTYGVGDHSKVTTEANVRIAPLYMLLLEKIGDEWSSVSSAKLHHFGILATHTKSDKYNKPYRHTPVRTIGETEGRIYVSYCGREAAAEMMDRSNSPTTHRKVVESILAADKPTNIPYAIDRKRVPLGNCKALQLVKHSMLCFGIKMVYRKKP